MRRRKRKADKGKAELQHAKNRLFQRYGIVLTKDRKRKLWEDIRKGRYTFLYKQSNRVFVYEVRISGRSIPMVYDKQRKMPVTFLEWRHLNDKRLSYEDTWDNALEFKFEEG